MPEQQAPTWPLDADLVSRTRAGEKAAFGLLVERYWPMAVALALARTRDGAYAEDIAQEGFLRAYDHLADLREPQRFGGWLSRIIVQESVNCLRRHKRNGSMSLAQIPATQEPVSREMTDAPALSEPQRQSIREAIHHLPAKLQQVVLMRFMADLPAPAIAEQLGQRPGTIRVWLHRAYRRLRPEITSILEDQEVES